MKIRQLRAPVIACGILGLLVLGLAIAIVNQQVTNSWLSVEIKQQHELLSNRKKETAAYQVTAGNYDKLSSELGGRYRTVSWSRQMPFIVNQVTGIMQARGLKVVTLRTEPITSGDGISHLPLRIGFKAGLGDLAKLLQDFEMTRPFLDIERLDVTAPSDKSDTLDIDMTVTSFAIVDENARDTYGEKDMQTPGVAAAGHRGGT